MILFVYGGKEVKVIYGVEGRTRHSCWCDQDWERGWNVLFLDLGIVFKDAFILRKFTESCFTICAFLLYVRYSPIKILTIKKVVLKFCFTDPRKSHRIPRKPPH